MLKLLFIFGINLVMDLEEETQVIPTKLLPASHLLAKELCFRVLQVELFKLKTLTADLLKKVRILFSTDPLLTAMPSLLRKVIQCIVLVQPYQTPRIP